MHPAQPPTRPPAQSQNVDAPSPVASHSAQSRHRSVHQTPSTQHEPVASPVNMVGPSHPMPRQRVYFGPYLLLQTLGEGEFGKVKLGVHSSPDRWGEEVAIKLIKRGNVDTQARMIKVAREIDVLKLVKHPNIVRLYDVIETEKYIGIVLEYASGGELFDHILAHRYLKEKDASKLFAQLISGVTYLHAKKIVHRDLKLENLLLDRNRNIIITDFGFANRFEDRTNDLMATSCGSPCYAAPELVVQDGRYVGSQVDVWSCGVILYAMLAGYLPFDDDPSNPDGDNINLLYKYIINTPLSFPDWISDEPKDLLLKMLVPDPLKRCSLKDVANHSWLSRYQHLFTRSLEELERLSEENEQAKRLMLQRQRQLMAANNANRSQPTLGPDGKPTHATGNAAAANRARGHQSAMVVPSSAMVSPDEALHSNHVIGAYQQQQRQVPGGVVTHLHSNSNQSTTAPTPSNRRHQQAQSAVIVPVSSLNKENEEIAAVPPIPSDKMIIDEEPKKSGSSVSGKKRKVAGTSTSPSVPPTAPQSQQRYTVQVEYTGVAKGKAKNVEPSTTGGEAPEPHSPTQGATAIDEGQVSTPRMSTPAPAVSLSSTPKHANDSPLQSTPQPSRNPKASVTGSSNTPKALDPSSVGSDETSTPTVPFPSPSQKPLANQGVVGATKTSSQVSFSAASHTSAQPNGSTSKATAAKSQARHRKGLSTDRFFSRLLGANTTQPSNPPPVPTPKKASAYTTANPPVAKTARRKALSMVVEPLSGKIASAAGARPTRKSAKVAPPTPTSAEAQQPDQSKRRQRGTSMAPASSSNPPVDGSTPPPVPTSDKSKASSVKRRTTLTAAHGRTASSKMPASGSAPLVTALKKPASQQSGPPSVQATPPHEDETSGPQREGQTASPNWSHHTPAASVANSTGQASNSSKAKRVMDWFRFKSLNGSTTSTNQPHAHASDHLVPPVPIPTDFDARVKAHQPAQLAQQSSVDGNSPPVGPEPTSQAPAPLMSNQSVTQTSAVSSKASHRFTLAHPRPSTSTAAEFSNTPNAPPAASERNGVFNDNKLKLHHGAIDQNAISSKLPPVIMQQLKQILWEMGIDVVEESSMKLKATRRSKKKVVASLGMGVFEALQQQQQKLHQQDGSTGAFKSIFNRRPQTASSTNQQIGVLIDQFGHVTTGPSVASTSGHGAGSAGGSLGSANGADYTSGAQPLPSYADDPSVDSGDDVRFTVEITRLRGLVGLYAVDIKRLKGSLWSFKYLYLQILERADLGQKA
ncbi:CAMK/CAMKL/KIN4 protein kinase [Puccinia graminis f. sp. tritici CRL 75-36-700-3]|uniref:non-specific serine/threonine protein kinase n=1 Tax=Puccinia graminis f. sp. tritici (strain CRL 75-36-700-3 / race SCCL) TaxID=418459 RepID=E3NXT3_PUCGT|nr:CAMK/CAMKL/KIN4 protein kinase [Puccinia graminis f. sp. tritici CRL 75-36-700-3]EFP94382.2 CAMK/CAMKL/KIN4 protein kinase [Puccinia graminis f. sp. tritici CRL 75-36-700-3]